MKSPPDFDPYLLLGVDAHSDAITIDRAYKMRIRAVHPDVAGPSGLEETKRLNVAREWLLDPELRAQLPRPSAPAWEPGPREPWPSAAAEQATAEPHPSWAWSTDRPRHTAPGSYDPLEDDPLTFDYGDRAQVLQERLVIFAELRQSLQEGVQLANLEPRPGHGWGQMGDDLVATLQLNANAFRVNAIH